MHIEEKSELEERITIYIYDDWYKTISRGSVIIDKKPEGRPAGLIEDIWTDENYRQRGLASKIMKRLIEIAKEKDCYKCVLVCSNENKNFYSKLGFKEHQNGMRLDLNG